ncbi:transferase family-domain-containing protein [Daedaleopsis nitida]|nr:transferase family-domain-containing protein [Daedaleopsis nitida]
METTRIVPTPIFDNTTHTVPLSITDNWTLRWSVTSAVWYYNSVDPQSESLIAEELDSHNVVGTAALATDALVKSLRCTIDSYRLWAGQLHWMPYDPSRGQRHARLAVTYGSSSDPGVELIRASCPSSLATLLPDAQERLSQQTWDASFFPSDRLLLPTSLALIGTDQHEGLPCVSVQLTTFACGAVGIGIRAVHPIADATTLVQFVKDWSSNHRAMLADTHPHPIAPVFDPALLDHAAAGDIAALDPDPNLIGVSRSLPMHRYDCWSSAEGCPAPMLPLTQIPADLRGTDIGPRGEPLPWSEWDLSAPVAHRHLYFTPSAIKCMWDEATSYTGVLSGQPPISRLDALLAFLWRLLVRARGMEKDRTNVHLGILLGLRSRLSPPLPDGFLGSPVTVARVSLTGEEIASPSHPSTLATVAQAIRCTTAQFTPETVPALLHDMAHVVDPNRFWVAFYGRRHAVVNSWLNLGAYDVDFGSGAPPRYVDVIMPSVDGCIHIMEAGVPWHGSDEDSERSRREERRWYDEPVCVSLHLAEDVMDRLLEDPGLIEGNLGCRLVGRV